MGCTGEADGVAAECGAQEDALDDGLSRGAGERRDGCAVVVVFGGVHDEGGVAAALDAEEWAAERRVGERGSGGAELFEGRVGGGWEQQPGCAEVALQRERFGAAVEPARVVRGDGAADEGRRAVVSGGGRRGGIGSGLVGR